MLPSLEGAKRGSSTAPTEVLCEQSAIPTAGTPDRCALDNTRFRTGVRGESSSRRRMARVRDTGMGGLVQQPAALGAHRQHPPAEAEERYYAMLEQPARRRNSNPMASDKPRGTFSGPFINLS